MPPRICALVLARLITPALEALRVMEKKYGSSHIQTNTEEVRSARGGCPRGAKSLFESERHRTCNLADRHRTSVPPLFRTQVSRQRRGAEPALVRKSGLEEVHTGSGQDDGTAGDLGRVLLHDGRGVLDGEEATV